MLLCTIKYCKITTSGIYIILIIYRYIMWHQGCNGVSISLWTFPVIRLPGENCCFVPFLRHSKSEPREVGTTMGPCMPIILSALSAYIHTVYIAVERRCQTPQVAAESRQSERVCEIADASASFQSEVRKHFPRVKRLENVTCSPKKTPKQNSMQTT